jgi:glucan biosynthesis protein C
MAKEGAGTRRLLFVDNLRILLVSLVIVWHTAVTYGASGAWPYHEGPPNDLANLVFTVLNVTVGPFVLPLFFMIAGYFAVPSYERKGFGPFVGERILRLGVPVLLYIAVLDPLIHYAIKLKTELYTGSLREYVMRHFEGCRRLGVGPMWFLEALLIFTLFYGLWRRIVKPEACQVEPRAGVPDTPAIVIFALTLGVATFVLRVWVPIDSALTPLGMPLPLFPQYVAMFVVGTVAYARNWLVNAPDSMGRQWLAIAVAFIAVVFPAIGILGDAFAGDATPFMGGITWQSLSLSVYEQFACVGMTIAAVVWFRRRFDYQGTLARALSSASFAAYFIHAPVLVLLALGFGNIRLHPLLKFAGVAPLSVILCFFLAHCLRRLPLVRNVL